MPAVASRCPPPCLAVRDPDTATQGRNPSSLGLADGAGRVLGSECLVGDAKMSFDRREGPLNVGFPLSH